MFGKLCGSTEFRTYSFIETLGAKGHKTLICDILVYEEILNQSEYKYELNCKQLSLNTSAR